jgi:hypothetical protein
MARPRTRARQAPPSTPAAVLAAMPATLALALFDHLPDTYLFVKDREHRFVHVNAALARLNGCRVAREMIGRGDFDYHPPALAAQYVAEDDRVMTRGEALVDQLWLVPGADGLPLWYRSSKVPLRSADGSVLGIAGVMRPAVHSGPMPEDYARIGKALDLVLQRYRGPVGVGELARSAGLSVSQLQREFTRLLGLTPMAYVMRVRVLMAPTAASPSIAASATRAISPGSSAGIRA